MAKSEKKKKNSAEVALKKSKNENLKKGISFTSETAKKAQKKSVAKRKENRAYKEVAQEALAKLLGDGAMELLANIKDFKLLGTKDKLAILEHLANYSGQKPVDKKEITGKDGGSLVQKVFILPEELEEIDKHIDDVINDGQSQ